MKTNELVTILKEQEESLKQFLVCSLNKQKAIVQNDIENLHNSLNNEEKILSQIEKNGKKISSVIEKLAEDYGLELEAVSLSEFLNSHSRNFLRETISVLIGLSKRPLLDRKV
ncbi:MAG: flagellar export chaperone FlgN [Ignavibacteriaceae bacterium]